MWKDHPETKIIGDKNARVNTRRKLLFNEQALPPIVAPKSCVESNKNDDWIKSMNAELDEIEKNQTWEIVPRPANKNIVGTKWFFKNKFNEDGKVIRNEARLVCKGYA